MVMTAASDAGAGQDGRHAGRRPGRTRLSPEREQELYEAVIQLVREVGYETLTMDKIAATTRSSKATLYRQWQSKANLVITALDHARRPDITGIDTGALRTDLYELADRLVPVVAEETDLILAIAYAARRDPELGRAQRAMIVAPQRAALGVILGQAVARGEIPPDAPAMAFVPHLIIGAVLARGLVEGQNADADYLHAYIDTVVLPALRGA
jgi:AcrR family transcriptional regulator